MIDIVAVLSPAQALAVRSLGEEAERVDGVAALSEQTLLHLEAPAGEHRHLLLSDGDDLVGYAHLDHTEDEAGCELLVAPAHRRRGHGTRLLAAVTQLVPTVRIWAHGDLAPARAWTGHVGLVPVRELLRMARPLADLAEADIPLPDGYSVRTFTPADVDAWVALNARAFATHPEQSRITADDVRARMAEPWFDADGFFLVEAPATPAGDRPLAAFHWTKTEDGEGEVYVVGVDPGRQGLGLGKAATVVGLRHLARAGLPRVTLYVDGDNTAALATYGRLGFERISADVMYALPKGT